VSLALLSEPKSPGDPAAIITLLCLAGFIVSFAAPWGPVVWGDAARGPPLSVRGTAMGVAVCLHWAGNFLVSGPFPVGLDKWGAGPVFPGYAVIGVLAFLFGQPAQVGSSTAAPGTMPPPQIATTTSLSRA
jgi:sugar transport protein